jgi:nitric oxide reductase NorE protein
MALATPRALSDPPGGILLWIIVVLELLAFTMVFGVIAYLRIEAPEAFAEGQAGLDGGMGLVLTLSLLTSGWLVAEGVHLYREGPREGRDLRAGRFFLLSAASGGVFLVLKIVDYVHKAAEGHWLGATEFWDAYVLATGFHFAHVLVGLVLLVVVGNKLGRAPFEDAETAVAGTALFWHMCDVVWLFLFPLFYVRA